MSTNSSLAHHVLSVIKQKANRTTNATKRNVDLLLRLGLGKTKNTASNTAEHIMRLMGHDMTAKHEPTPETRLQVNTLASVGTPQDQIAIVIGITKNTLLLS